MTKYLFPAVGRPAVRSGNGLLRHSDESQPQGRTKAGGLVLHQLGREAAKPLSPGRSQRGSLRAFGRALRGTAECVLGSPLASVLGN
jgi:hypothetical protein